MKDIVSAALAQRGECDPSGAEKIPDERAEKDLEGKSQCPRPTLDSLMAGYPGIKPTEIDLGEAKGREIW